MDRAVINTGNGPVFIFSGCPAGWCDTLAFGFDVSDASYIPIYTRKQTFEQFAATGGTVCLALLKKQVIVGYAVLSHPSSNSRWAGFGDEKILELMAVEVSREFRKQGIARQLLTRLFFDVRLDERIVYLTAYAWLWDIPHTGLTCNGYRDMLINLYAEFGFVECRTNEPNICLKPENIFMARIGKNISRKDRNIFKWLRFGITP